MQSQNSKPEFEITDIISFKSLSPETDSMSGNELPSSPATTTKEEPRSGRKPRPKTLKRRVQNREAQRKYRQKQLRAFEDLKRLAASVGNAEQKIGEDGNRTGGSTKDDGLLRLGDTDISSDCVDLGKSNPGFAHLVSATDVDLSDVSVMLWDKDQAMQIEALAALEHPLSAGSGSDSSVGMTGFPALGSFDSSMFSALDLDDLDIRLTPDLFGMQSLDTLFSREDLTVARLSVNGQPSSKEMSRIKSWPENMPLEPPEGTSSHHRPAVYLNDHDQSLEILERNRPRDNFESFRRLFELENTAENSQLISLALERKHEIRDIMIAGFRAINSRTNSTPQAMAIFSAPVLSDPYKNNLRLIRVSTIDAYLSNAVTLGMSVAELYRDACPSPFYQSRRGNTDELKLSVARIAAQIPPHLRPTPPQVLCPHHPYLDLLPFPILRARAIALASRKPPLIDEKELKNDIMNDGLICWRTSGSGTGQPWDMRSWEAAPWFLRKWRVLVGDETEDIWKQTRWWNGMRGELIV